MGYKNQSYILWGKSIKETRREINEGEGKEDHQDKKRNRLEAYSRKVMTVKYYKRVREQMAQWGGERRGNIELKRGKKLRMDRKGQDAGQTNFRQ